MYRLTGNDRQIFAGATLVCSLSRSLTIITIFLSEIFKIP